MEFENYYCRLGLNYAGMISLSVAWLHEYVNQRQINLDANAAPGCVQEDDLYLMFFTHKGSVVAEATGRVFAMNREFISLDVLSQQVLMNLDRQTDEVKL